MNNAWKPARGTKDKRLLSKRVDEGLPPVTEDKRQPEIVGKGPPLATRNDKQLAKIDKGPLPTTRDKKQPATATEDDKTPPPDVIKDNRG